ncbi:MAG: ADP-ribosylglycohydrolase family protein, partial [Acidobacteriota bacterium]|nr:ADP-ribosylglycohydrolase family protein [Acidobacteriota bacterium]
MRRYHIMLSVTALALLASSSIAQGFRQIDLDVLQDKMRGAWAGQMIGVSYGAPYEFHYQGSIMEDPIRDWEPGFVDNSIHQDDLYVEMTFLRALEVHGLDITYEQAGQAFADSQYGLWHANYYGRENCRNGIMPPLSGDPFHNAHFDDIDYQIEADFGGIICPGMPLASNRISDVFGHVMNYGDGVYGGMWVAAMYAEAYFESDVETVVRRALLAIPAESTYAMLIQDVLDFHAKEPDDWRACWQMLEDKWGHVDLCPRVEERPSTSTRSSTAGTSPWACSTGMATGRRHWSCPPVAAKTTIVTHRTPQVCSGASWVTKVSPRSTAGASPASPRRSSAIPTTASIASPMSA